MQELSDILAAIPQPSTQQEAAEEAAAAAAARRIAPAPAGRAGKKHGAAAHAAPAQDVEADEEEDGGGAGSDGEEQEGGSAGVEAGLEEEQQGEEQPQEQEQEQQAPAGRLAARRRKHFLQTFVFSATLTLPANLRKRLRKASAEELNKLLKSICMDPPGSRGQRCGPVQGKPPGCGARSKRAAGTQSISLCSSAARRQRSSLPAM